MRVSSGYSGEFYRRSAPGRLAARARQPAAEDTHADGDVLGLLWRCRWPVLIGLLSGLALGGAYLLLAPKKYAASASLLLDPRLGHTMSEAGGLNPVGDALAVDSQVKLLTAQTVLARLAKSENLAADPIFNRSQGGLLSRLLGGAPSLPGGADLKLLADSFVIKRPERTYVVEITATARTPQQAADFANGLARAYNQDQIEARVSAAQNDANWVRQKLEQLAKDIALAEAKVEAYKSANHIVAADGLRSNELQIAEATRELGLARGRVSAAKARLDQIQRAAREGRVGAADEALKSPTIERLRGQQANSEREVARLARTLGERHPALLEAQAQADRVRALLVDELNRIAASAQNDYLTEQGNEQQLTHGLDRLKAQSNETSRNNLPLRQLERDVEVARGSYDKFSKLEEFAGAARGRQPAGADYRRRRVRRSRRRVRCPSWSCRSPQAPDFSLAFSSV